MGRNKTPSSWTDEGASSLQVPSCPFTDIDEHASFEYFAPCQPLGTELKAVVVPTEICGLALRNVLVLRFKNRCYHANRAGLNPRYFNPFSL